MNDLQNIIANSTFEKNKLYLIQKINDLFGFFYKDGEVYFAKSNSSNKSNNIETSYLNFETHIYLEKTSNDAQFESGYYDLLIFNQTVNNSYFDAYYNVCLAYARSNFEMSFFEFFDALNTIFKRKKSSYIDVIGFVGELIFIKKIFDDYNFDLTSSWHLSGKNSKFDFAFENFNLDVKTTTTNEKSFLIKQNQIKNNQENYLGIVGLIPTGKGESINSLINYFQTTEPFANNVRFLIELNENKNKIKSEEEMDIYFSLNSIKIIKCSNMNFIENIPLEISNLVYNYDFSLTKTEDINEFVKQIIGEE